MVYDLPPPTISRYVLDENTTSETIADNGRKDVAFQIGDWVFIHLRPYRKLSLRLQRHTKLSQRLFGPFQLLQ